MVRLVHPDTKGVVYVEERSLAHYLPNGWVQEEEPPKPASKPASKTSKATTQKEQD